MSKIKAAWAGVERNKSETQYKKALDLYNKNKSLFERLWKEGRIPNGHVPMAIVRMSDDAVNSNEIVFRYLAPEVKAQPESNQKAALNDVVSNLQKKKAPQNKSLLDFIARENISTLGQLLDAIVKEQEARVKRVMGKPSCEGRCERHTNLGPKSSNVLRTIHCSGGKDSK